MVGFNKTACPADSLSKAAELLRDELKVKGKDADQYRTKWSTIC